MEAAFNERRALAFGLVAVGLWSTVATGFKLGLERLTVEQLLLLGAAVSWVVFLVYALVAKEINPRQVPLGRVALYGLLNPCAYYLVLFAAYARLPAHIAQPINYTWAITLAILAVPILKQPLSSRTLGGILISYTGVVILLLTSAEMSWQSASILGVALALGSTVLWAYYWLLTTREDIHPAGLMFWSFTIALPVLFGICWLGPGLPAVNLTTLTYGAWVGVVEMGVTFICWQQALRLTANTARIGQLIFLSPFLSLVIIHFALGEEITTGAIFGLIVIVAGLYLARAKSTP